ncbi:MAG: hypothetical protein M3R38_06050 [Actinomycetota bacterium]|nr:hypothetical protein [Actinomycetota bacterium]
MEEQHASVSEIRRYPIRPEGFEEPLFHGRASKVAVMEHFLGAPWLGKASELPDRGGTGEVARVREEPVEVRRASPHRGRGGAEIMVFGLPCPGGRRGRGGSGGHRRALRRRRRVAQVLARWREVRGWWEPVGGEDRFLYRLLLSDGAVVDVARERPSGEWALVGVAD